MVTTKNLTNEYAGLSTDEKPVTGVANGSTFFEVDTGKNYAFDETNTEWHEFSTGSGGGGGSSSYTEDTKEELWSGSVTTEKIGAQVPYYVGSITDTILPEGSSYPESLTITFDGTDYTCEVQKYTGTTMGIYGATVDMATQEVDFSKYPFALLIQDTYSTVATEDEGEFAITISNIIKTPTYEFSEAVELVLKDKLRVVLTDLGEDTVSDKTRDEIIEAYNNGLYVYCDYYGNCYTPVTIVSEHVEFIFVSISPYIEPHLYAQNIVFEDDGSIIFSDVDIYSAAQGS